jgi:N-acetylglucosaminyldiphosphoundecaprenol N-acetyl-beta-D-mannosaminyltransferase
MGVRFAAVTESQAAQALVDAAADSLGYWTMTVNLDHLRRYLSEPVARELIDEADMVVADGKPLVWASRLAGEPLPERVAGSDLIWSISEAASHRGASIFLLGGNPGVAGGAAEALLARYSDLKIAGTFCPPFGFEHDAEELRRIEDQIRSTRPQIVLVGLGFPKQDTLIKRLRPIAPGTSFIGVGISLSFVAGELSRAPAWMQALGVEWLYRLAQEPTRLVRRYLLQGLPFALRMMAAAARHRVRGDDSGS